MARMADLITDALAAEVKSRTGWDEAPGLYFLYLEGGRPRLSQVPLPDEIWATARPPQVLAGLASGLGMFADLLRRVAPEGLHGAAFRCETWMVDGGKPGTERASEVAAASMAKRLHRHPDRVEARNMYAVDRAGITYDAVLVRGEDEVRTSAAYPKPGGGAVFTGTVPAALDRLVMVLLGVELPARERVR